MQIKAEIKAWGYKIIQKYLLWERREEQQVGGGTSQDWEHTRTTSLPPHALRPGIRYLEWSLNSPHGPWGCGGGGVPCVLGGGLGKAGVRGVMLVWGSCMLFIYLFFACFLFIYFFWYLCLLVRGCQCAMLVCGCCFIFFCLFCLFGVHGCLFLVYFYLFLFPVIRIHSSVGVCTLLTCVTWCLWRACVWV